MSRKDRWKDRMVMSFILMGICLGSLNAFQSFTTCQWISDVVSILMGLFFVIGTISFFEYRNS